MFTNLASRVSPFLPRQRKGVERGKILGIERLRVTLTPNGKREIAPLDHVFPFIVVYCLLLLLRNETIHASFIHKNFSGQFLSAYFLLNVNLNLTFAVCRKRGS